MNTAERVKDITVKIDGVPKQFLLTNHAMNQLQARFKMGDFLTHFAKHAKNYEVATALASTIGRKSLEPTTYLRYKPADIIVVLSHNFDFHVVITAYSASDCSKRFSKMRWQPFNQYEWAFA